MMHSIISAGFAHSLAIAAEGVVWSWGSNEYGQIGNEAAASPFRALPKPVAMPPAVSVAAGGVHSLALLKKDGAIAAGGAHSLALLEGGRLMAWGANDYGQLGDGTQTGRLQPAGVTGIGPIG